MKESSQSLDLQGECSLFVLKDTLNAPKGVGSSHHDNKWRYIICIICTPVWHATDLARRLIQLLQWTSHTSQLIRTVHNVYITSCTSHIITSNSKCYWLQNWRHIQGPATRNTKQYNYGLVKITATSYSTSYIALHVVCVLLILLWREVAVHDVSVKVPLAIYSLPDNNIPKEQEHKILKYLHT